MLTYGDITRDETALPEASLKALLQRGFSHFLGNEQASKVVSRIRTAVATTMSTPEKEVNQKDISKEQVQTFRAENEELVIKFERDVLASALDALDNGTIGQSAGGTRGPKVDSFTATMNGLAKAEVVTTLKANGLKVPKGEEVVTFANGQTKTMAEMVATRLANHGDRLKLAAEKELAAKARASAKAKVEGEATAETLGL